MTKASVLKELRAAPLRSKLQLLSLAVSAGGIVVMLGSGVAWAIWSRVGGPIMLFDPRFDLCQDIGMWGFVALGTGACAMGFVHGDASFRSRLGRYGAVVFWASLLAITAFPHLTIAEFSATVVGRVLITGLVVGCLASAVTVAMDLTAKFWGKKPVTAPN